MNNDNSIYLTVAITGMNARADNPGPGLAVARCLRESANFKGRIIGLGYDTFDPGLYLTDICDASYLLPYPSAGSEAMIKQIKKIQEHENIDLLIPCLDSELDSIVSLKNKLNELGIQTFIPDKQQLELRNKSRLAELVESLGMKCPRTITISDVGFFNDCHKTNWHFPLVIKGLLYDAKTVFNVSEASAAFMEISRVWGAPVIVQEYIIGDEINLSLVGDGKGDYNGPVMMRKQAVTNKGKVWAGVTVYDKNFHELADELIKATKWRGPLELEAMRCNDGSYNIIEINPRFPAWIYLSCAVENNLPMSLLNLSVGKTAPVFLKIKPGTVYLRYAQEVVVSPEQYQNMCIKGEI